LKKKLKNGQTRVVQRPRESRYYDTETPRRRLYSYKTKHHPAKIRPSIQPGKIVILLSGKFRGRRVVVLGRLPSGLILVTGPYVVNGVPIKRVNPAYVIATSTSIDISHIELDPKFNDDYFTRPKKKRENKTTEPEQRFESQEKKRRTREKNYRSE